MTLHFPPPPLPFLPLIFVLLFPSQLRETEVELQRLHNRIAEDRYEGRRWRVNGKGESGERGETRVKYKRTARFRLPCPPIFSLFSYPSLFLLSPSPPSLSSTHTGPESMKRGFMLSLVSWRMSVIDCRQQRDRPWNPHHCCCSSSLTCLK